MSACPTYSPLNEMRDPVTITGTGEDMSDETVQTSIGTSSSKPSRRILWIGLACSVAYIAIMGIYALSVWHLMLEMKPADFATFLSGVFAPLAFLWLVLGFMQQGDELKHSAEALWLQGQELQNSVEQQKQLVGVTKEQLEIERTSRAKAEEDAEQAAQPVLFMNHVGSGSSRSDRFFGYVLRSAGPPCADMDVYTSGDLHGSRSHFAAGSEYNLEFQFAVEEEVEPAELLIEYTDTRGRRRAQRFKIPSYGDGSRSGLGSPERVPGVEKRDGTSDA